MAAFYDPNHSTPLGNGLSWLLNNDGWLRKKKEEEARAAMGLPPAAYAQNMGLARKVDSALPQVPLGNEGQQRAISGAQVAQAAATGQLNKEAAQADTAPPVPEVQPPAAVQSVANEVKTPRPPQPGLGSFNYDTEKGILDKKAGLAKNLMGAKGDEGRMISGWYSSGGVGSTLGALAQNLVGGYISGKSDEAAKELDKKAMENYSKAASYDPTYAGPDTVVPGQEIPTSQYMTSAAADRELAGEGPVNTAALSAQLQGIPAGEPMTSAAADRVPPQQPALLPQLSQAPRSAMPDMTVPAQPLNPQQIAANKAQQLQALWNSGPIGRAQVGAIITGKDQQSLKGRYDISPPTEHSPGYKLDTWTGKEVPLTAGERQMSIRDQIAVNKDNREQSEYTDKKQETMSSATGHIETLDAGLNILGGILGGKTINGVPEKIDKATGMVAGIKEAAGNLFKTGSVPGDIKNDIDIGMGKIYNSSIALARAGGLSASQVNSDRDVALTLSGTTVLERFNKGQLSAAAATRALQEAADAGQRVRERFANKVTSAGGTPPANNREISREKINELAKREGVTPEEIEAFYRSKGRYVK